MRHALFALPLLLLLPHAPAVAGEGSSTDALKALDNEGLALLKARFSVQGKDSLVERELRLSRVESGQDATGRYDLFHYRLQAATPEATSSIAPVEGELQLKRYLTGGVTLASLDYQGPTLSGQNSLQVTMHLPKYARGMALQRYNPYWTGPSFASDYRLLPESNVMVLWQQLEDDDYHVLVPLAGDGMVGQVGKNNLRFGVTLSGEAPSTPRHVPLFAFATGDDPYRLTQDAYQAAFADSHFYGRLRADKPFPEVFRSFGWCSWNAYSDQVTEQDILRSARSLKAKQIPVGFMLIDDGWLTVQDRRLSGFGADPRKFSKGLGWLTSTLRWDYGVPHVGVWHALQGYWSGVDASSSIGEAYHLFEGPDRSFLPDPREAAGEPFYADWYRHLRSVGIDFVKVDGQANNARFTNGLLPLFSSAEGTQKSVQEAASTQFKGTDDSLNVLNCMSLTLEHAYNWRYSNLVRTSNDFVPDEPWTNKEHVFQNAYNSFWASNFAYPDYDMFQSNLPQAEYQAIARAMSGGPIYVSDEAGKENAELLGRLMLSSGRLLMLDGPGQVTRDTLLVDTGLVPVPLKLSGCIRRPGLTAGMVGAFNVNKGAAEVVGTLRPADAEGLEGTSWAVYERSTGRLKVLERQQELPVRLGEYGAELYTLAPVEGHVAVLGLLDKYLGPAAVQEVRREGREVVVTLEAPGEFGAYVKSWPKTIKVGDRVLTAHGYRYRNRLLTIPRTSFRDGEDPVVRITL
ncbi:MAG TPA: Sip1-related alpha-galactosidase [Stenomitos sp.]